MRFVSLSLQSVSLLMWVLGMCMSWLYLTVVGKKCLQIAQSWRCSRTYRNCRSIRKATDVVTCVGGESLKYWAEVKLWVKVQIITSLNSLTLKSENTWEDILSRTMKVKYSRNKWTKHALSRKAKALGGPMQRVQLYEYPRLLRSIFKSWSTKFVMRMEVIRWYVACRFNYNFLCCTTLLNLWGKYRN